MEEHAKKIFLETSEGRCTPAVCSSSQRIRSYYLGDYLSKQSTLSLLQNLHLKWIYKHSGCEKTSFESVSVSSEYYPSALRSEYLAGQSHPSSYQSLLGTLMQLLSVVDRRWTRMTYESDCETQYITLAKTMACIHDSMQIVGSP